MNAKALPCLNGATCVDGVNMYNLYLFVPISLEHTAKPVSIKLKDINVLISCHEKLPGSYILIEAIIKDLYIKIVSNTKNMPSKMTWYNMKSLNAKTDITPIQTFLN